MVSLAAAGGSGGTTDPLYLTLDPFQAPPVDVAALG